MKTRTIRQSVWFDAPPHEVYEVLMDSKKHTQLAGAKSTVSRKVGGRFSISDGYMIGENLEIVPDKKIVQTWKPEEDCWPEGHYSKITFSLTPSRGGTRLVFTHSGVPVVCGKRFDSGWKDYYWTPMREMLQPHRD